MKVIYINPQSGYNLAQYDYNLLSNIKDADITYCCSTIYDAPIIENIDYRYVFHYNRKKTNLLKAFSYLWSLVKIFFIVLRIRPDVIHIQWWRLWIADYLFLSVLKRICSQVVFTAHNVVPHNSGDSMHLKCRKYYRKVDKIIVHVPGTKDELICDFRVDSRRIFIIPHGLLYSNCNRSSVEQQKQMLESQFKLKDKLVISAVGYQSPYKGVDIIKRAYLESEVLHHSSNAFFIVAGKGGIFTKEMMNTYDNLLVYDEFLSTELLTAIMEKTDVLLLPYRKISQSGVLLTAIEKEIPYIATDVGGLCEPLNIAPVGWQLKNNSVTEIQALLENITMYPRSVDIKRSNKEGWNKIKAYYDWKAIGKKTAICYRVKLE